MTWMKKPFRRRGFFGSIKFLSFVLDFPPFIPLALLHDLPYIAARNSGPGRWWIVS
jgi:hypothetical protein